MGTTLPGTKHTAKIEPWERDIVWKIKNAPGVKKLTTGRIAWTGSPRQRLQLRPHPLKEKIETIVAGWLHIASRKRVLTIFTTPAITLETLRDELAAVLEDFDIPVEVFDDHTHIEEVTMSPSESNGLSAVSQEQQWQYCLLVHDLVEQVQAHESEEARLLAEAERVRALKLRVQEDALEALAQGFVAKTPMKN